MQLQRMQRDSHNELGQLARRPRMIMSLRSSQSIMKLKASLFNSVELKNATQDLRQKSNGEAGPRVVRSAEERTLVLGR